MTDERVPDLGAVASPPRRELAYDDLEPTGRLGSGGEAVVRAARVPGPDSPDRVALREPRVDETTVDRETVAAFLDAVSAWRTLDRRERDRPRWADSEHVVGVVAAGERTPWVAMEFMDGGSLADRLAEAPDGLPLAEAVWIAESVARGVELAHQNGVAHLDLKPGNVLFRRTPGEQWHVPKIADWGLARALFDGGGTVEQFSPRYAAPEQFDRESFGEPDPLTDVYALGGLLYALLTGEPPYTGPRARVMHGALSPEPPAPPSEHRSAVPSALDEIVMQALSTDKGDRQRSVGLVVERLAALRRTGVDAEDSTASAGSSAAGGSAGSAGATEGAVAGDAATGGEATDAAATEDAATDATAAGDAATEDPEPRGGADLATRLSVPLADAYTGTTRELRLSRPERCPDCGGTGEVAGPQSARGDSDPRPQECRTCDGDGRFETETTIEIDVPAGIREGQTLRLGEEGVPPATADGEPGDLLIEVSVEDDPRFERDGADLYHDLDPDARPGESVRLPTPEGEVEVDLPGGLEDGEVLRLEGRGMPHLRESGFGDLYVRYHGH